jgi:benzoyl-CoA reductase subunit C
MNPFSAINDILSDPMGYAKRFKEESGSPVIGYLCSYTPEEIIFAAGAHPMRLFNTRESIRLAGAHLQTYCCSLVRGILDDALSGELDFLDGAVFPHTCDSIQRLSDIWRLNIPFGFHADIVLPVKLNTDSARQYMVDVIMKFKSDLEARLGREVTEDRLAISIALFNRIRADLKTVYDLRAANPEILSGRDLHNLVRVGMIMDRRLFAEWLSDVVAALGAKKGAEKPMDRKRIVLAGGLCNDPDIHPVIEDAGGVAVWDDFCTGSRYVEGMIATDGDPVSAIADRLLSRVVCPAKHSGLHNRADNLVRIVREKRADGVVFSLLKFCDPHAFDYPYLKNRLDAEGIPSVLIEIDDRPVTEGRLKTRIEAFIEML